MIVDSLGVQIRWLLLYGVLPTEMLAADSRERRATGRQAIAAARLAACSLAQICRRSPVSSLTT